MKKDRKTIRLKPDIVMKQYWQDNERFADLFNTVLFQGKEMIKPDELTDKPEGVSGVITSKSMMQTFPRYRDVLKQSKNRGVSFAILGIENQMKVHYAMPLRAMLYDGLTYQKQCDELAKKYKQTKELKAAEFLSHMKQEDRLQPVLSIVLYYGAEPWDGAKTLTDMLDVSVELKPFINDYHMCLVEVARNNIVLKNHDNINFFEAVELFQRSDITEEERIFRIQEFSNTHSYSRDVTIAVAAVTDNRDILDNLDSEGEIDMCTLYEYCRTKGREEGREEGSERVNHLIQLLLANSRESEIEKAVTDREYQQRLFEEFHL